MTETETATEPEGAEMTAADLAAVRELALQAHPDAVAELVSGGTVAEIVASVESARAAYQRIVAAARATEMPSAPAAPTPPAPSVPAGGVPPLALDPERLPATEKIRRGLANQ